MIRNSIAAKAILPVVITVAVVLGVCGFVVIRTQTGALRARARRNGAYVGELVYQYLRQAMLTKGADEVQQFINNIGWSDEIRRVFVFNEDGEIVYSSMRYDVGNDVTGSYLQLAGMEGAFPHSLISDDRRTLMIVRTIENNSECQACHGAEVARLGSLGLEVSLVAAENEVAENQNWIILFAVVILILVSTIVSAFVLLFVKRPVRSLVATMAEVEQGNLTARFAVGSRDELGLLGESFNSMVGKLEQLQAELRQHHEQQLQHADRLASIGQLASGIAHEIKNPLAGISAAIQILSKELSLSDIHQEIIDEIVEQLTRLNKSAKDLLSFARPPEPRFLEADLNEVIRAAEFLVTKQAEQQKVDIESSLDPNIPLAAIDPGQMQQVFLNIMLNAVQAMPDGGCLSIVTRLVPHGENQQGEDITASFADTGQGIPGTETNKIFGPFYTTKHRGTGLGLSISRNIVERHGGRFDVESEVGKGTRMSIILPLREGYSG